MGVGQWAMGTSFMNESRSERCASKWGEGAPSEKCARTSVKVATSSWKVRSTVMRTPAW